MIGLNRKEKEHLIVDLYNNGCSYRQIAKEARVSLRDIKGILDKENGEHSLSKSSEAYQMFSEGKSPMEVAIALNMRESEVTQLYKESWTLKQIYDLNFIYLETRGDLASFVRLYKLSKESGLNAEHAVSILKLADDNLLQLEQKYHNLKLEVESLEEMTKSSIRTLQDYDMQLNALGKSFDNYCQLCQEQEVKLNDLQKKRLREEALVSQFENNDKRYHKIRNIVEEKVYATLSNNTILLKLAVASIIQSMRNNPEQYIPLIRDNFPLTNYNNTLYHPFYTNGYNTQYFETLLLNDAVKVYNGLAKNLVDEILGRYNIRSSPSQSSLPLILPSDQELTSGLDK